MLSYEEVNKTHDHLNKIYTPKFWDWDKIVYTPNNPSIWHISISIMEIVYCMFNPTTISREWSDYTLCRNTITLVSHNVQNVDPAQNWQRISEEWTRLHYDVIVNHDQAWVSSLCYPLLHSLHYTAMFYLCTLCFKGATSNIHPGNIFVLIKVE